MVASAEDQARLIVLIETQQAKFAKDMAKMAGTATKTAGDIERTFANSNSRLAGGFARAGTQGEASMKQIRAGATNLSFQLNDIAQQLATGTSPFTVMVQQGSQVAQIMQQMGGGVRGAVGALGAAFGSMLNPISLISVALIGAVGYAVQYFTTVEDGSDDSAATLKKHADLIKQIADKYGEAIPAIRKYAQELAAVAEKGEVEQATNLTRTALYDQVKASITSLGDGMTELADKVSRLAAPEDMDRVNALQDAMLKLQKQVKDGVVPSTEDLENISRMLADTFKQYGIPQAAALAGAMAVITQETDKARTAIDGLNSSVASMKQPELGQLSGGIDQAFDQANLFGSQGIIGKGDAAAWKEFLSTRATSMAATGDAIKNLDDELAEKVGMLAKQFPDIKINEAFRTREYQSQLYTKLHGVSPVAAPGTSRHEKGLAVDITIPPEQMAAVSAAAKLLGLENPIKGDRGHFQLQGGANLESGVERKGRTAREKATPFDDWQTKGAQDLELKKQELAINGQLWQTDASRNAEIEKGRLIQEGLNKAKEQGIPITAALRAEIEGQAEALSQVGVKSEEAKVKQENWMKQQELMTQQLTQFKDAVTQAFSSGITSFIDDLIAGKDAGEAFANMLANIGKQILDLAIQLAVKSLFGGLFGGGGGLSLFPSAHTGGVAGRTGGRRRVSPLAFAGAPRMHSGGVAGLRMDEVPTILQRGEVVLPKGSRVNSSRGGAGGRTDIKNNIGDINIDMSQGGQVTSDSEDGKVLGQQMRKIIQAEIVQQSRPGGLLRPRRETR